MLLLELHSGKPGIGPHGENSNDRPEKAMVNKIVDLCLPDRSDASYSKAYDFLESDWGGVLWDKYYEAFRAKVEKDISLPKGSPGLKSFNKAARELYGKWERKVKFTGTPVKEAACC